jgi:hypothetical protein
MDTSSSHISKQTTIFSVDLPLDSESGSKHMHGSQVWGLLLQLSTYFQASADHSFFVCFSDCSAPLVVVAMVPGG